VKFVLKRLSLVMVVLLAGILAVESLALLATGGPRVASYFVDASVPLTYSLNTGRYVYWHRDRLVQVVVGPDGKRDSGEKRAGATEVWIIGDSQVFGWGLTTGETIASQLQNMLGDSFFVVNAGVPGYGPYSYLNVVRSAPKSALKIVLFTETNDAQDTYSELPYGRVHCGLLVEPRTPWSQLPCWMLKSQTLSLLVDLQNLVEPPRLAPSLNCNPSLRGAASVIHSRLMAIASSLREVENVRLGTIPWDARLYPSRLSDYRPNLSSVSCAWEFPDDLGLVQAARRTGIGELFQPADHHLSANGAKFIAGQIAEQLKLRVEPGDGGRY